MRTCRTNLRWRAAVQLLVWLAIASVPPKAIAGQSETLPHDLRSCADGIAAAENSGYEWYSGGAIDDTLRIDGAKLLAPLHLQRVLDETDAWLVIVEGGHFEGWVFAEMRFPARLCFHRANLKNTDWHGADAHGFAFVESQLSGSDFTGARLTRIWLENVDLIDVQMRGTDLSGGRLRGGWWGGDLRRWNLDKANLSAFRFDCGVSVDDGCPIENESMSMRGTVLEGADISRLRLPPDFEADDALLGDTYVVPSQLAQLAKARAISPVKLVGGQDSLAITPKEFHFLASEALRERERLAGPSFSCAMARTRVEEMICGADGHRLRWMDIEMAALFRLLFSVDGTELPLQREWLRSRDQCRSINCLELHYAKRIADMQEVLAGIDWLAAGEMRIFISPTLRFGSEVESSPLFQRLVPTLIADSNSIAILSRALDGSYSVVADSFGANAHVCNATATGLRRKSERQEDRAWLRFPQRDAASEIDQDDGRIVQFDGRFLRFFKLGKPRLRTHPQSSAAMNCGARAMLHEMYPLPLSQEQARQLADRLAPQDQTR